MEFKEKLQELRKQRNITQEELAASLYVSRTAISKWESGRGYPSIDSLKTIAKFFSVTVDELLSSDQALTIAKENEKQLKNHFLDLVYGLLDLSAVLLFFLPFFANTSSGDIQIASLLQLNGIQLYLKATYITVVILAAVMGILTLSLQNCMSTLWLKAKTALSLGIGVICVLIFMISSQPYAAFFVFTLLIIKVLVLFKHK